MKAPSAEFWHRQARHTAIRHNIACFLGEFLPWCLGASAIFACGLLFARENNAAGLTAWITYGGTLLACLGIAGWRCRHLFFTLEDAMVRMDWQMGLHNRLSAATAGVGEFPGARPVSDGYAIRWRKIVLPLGCSAALILAAAYIPVTRQIVTYRPPATPIAWTQTAQWVDALKKTEALQEAPVEDLRERLEQLRKQPAEDWYSQSSLEAGDNLRDEAEQSIQALQRDLQSALGNLSAMEKFSDTTSAAETKAAHENLASALKGLALGNLPLNADLLRNLKDADLSNLRALTPSQLAALKERLKAGDKVCQECLHPGEMAGRIKEAALVSAGQPGGTGGGTESAPLSLNEKPAQLGSTAAAPVASGNLDRALPGDLVGIGKGEHQVDPAKYAGPAPAGAAASTRSGGEVVWRNDLTPKESEAIKNFFQ